MSFIPIEPKDYSDGRTKQSYKDSTDINEILKRAARTGTISHLAKYGEQYGDFSGFDFQEAQNQIAKAKTIFEELPAEVRREFKNDPSAFFEFCNAPENQERLEELLPAIAEPGQYFPSVKIPRAADNPVAAGDAEPPLAERPRVPEGENVTPAA